MASTIELGLLNKENGRISVEKCMNPFSRASDKKNPFSSAA